MFSSSSNFSAFSGDTNSASADAITNSDNASASSDSTFTSIVNSPAQSQAIKEIVKTEVEPVIVSHVNSPSDFFLQLVANKVVLDMVNDELDKHMKSEHGAVPVDHVEMGKSACERHHVVG
jgi:hypothetical protein